MTRASTRRSASAGEANEDAKTKIIARDGEVEGKADAEPSAKGGDGDDEAKQDGGDESDADEQTSSEETVEELEARMKTTSDESLLGELLAMEKHAFDPVNNLLNRAQFDELLDLQTDSEPTFMEEIVEMYCDDSQTMLDELKEILNDEEKRTTEGFDTARATLHKLRGASSTLGAEGIQHTCESLREAIVAEARDALSKGPGSLEELENRLNELKNFLKRYTCIGRECASRKLSRK
jgi:histidine-containing phosphotransfer protein